MGNKRCCGVGGGDGINENEGKKHENNSYQTRGDDNALSFLRNLQHEMVASSLREEKISFVYFHFITSSYGTHTPTPIRSILLAAATLYHKMPVGRRRAAF